MLIILNRHDITHYFPANTSIVSLYSHYSFNTNNSFISKIYRDTYLEHSLTTNLKTPGVRRPLDIQFRFRSIPSTIYTFLTRPYFNKSFYIEIIVQLLQYIKLKVLILSKMIYNKPVHGVWEI